MKYLSATVLALAAAAMQAGASAVDTGGDTDRMVTKRQSAKVPVYTTCKNPKQFALTFDDGPYTWENDLSKTLRANDAIGTFFVNGYNWGCIYDSANVELLKKTYAAGHIIASHTWGHTDITTLTFDQFHNQLWLVEEALLRILGVYPALFRPPYGKFNDMNLQVLKQRGYTGLIYWDFDSNDANGEAPKNSIARYQSLANTFPKGHLSLNHETVKTTSTQVIPSVAKTLKNKGYKLVGVPECLGIAPYQYVGKPQSRTSQWTCNGKPLPGKAN